MRPSLLTAIVRSFAALVTCLFAIPTAFAQPKDDAGSDIIYYGIDLCTKCHAAEKGKEPAANRIFTSRLTEAHTWLTYDKHKDATVALKNERSRQIAKLMGIKGDLTSEKQCVSCHGVYLDPANTALIHEESYGTAEQRERTGVSCVACHGPNRKWVSEHASILPAVPWRKRSKTEKIEQFGMYDLFDPAKRATLCFSCHIGDVDKGRVVTHEMYAAGHPPLPGIEIATFSEAMPAHWESMTEKIARARRLEAEAKTPKQKAELLNGFTFLEKAYEIKPDQEDMEQTRMVAVTSLMAIKSSLELTRRLAEVDNGARWPEFASFDCYACHHDLKPKSWRQTRGYRNRPGRVEPRPWPLALGQFAFALGDEKSRSLDKTLEGWHTVFQKTPFGDREAVVKNAKDAEKLLGDRIKQLQSVKFDRAAARRALDGLAELAGERDYDFDSARQFAWALQTILHEVESDGAKAAKPALPEPYAKLFAGLNKDLQLKLPEGQVEIVPQLLEAVYTQIAAYAPRDFRQKMVDLRKLLKSSK
jgi:hypothetical protein